MNAVKHGLTAKRIMIGDEDPREFEALQASLINDLKPLGHFGHEVVRNIAHDLWRLRRVAPMEAAVMRAELQAAKAQRQRGQASEGNAVQELFDELKRMGQRMRTDSESEHLKDNSKEVSDAHAEKQQEVVKQVPEEAPQESQDRAFAVIVCENKLGNLLRYETGLLTNLMRNFTLLHLLQSSRMKAENSTRVIESVAVEPRPRFRPRRDLS